MPIVLPMPGPGALLLVAALLIVYGLIRGIAAFHDFKRGRALHTAQGEAMVRFETIRHGRAIAHANAWRSESHRKDSDALQVVERG